MLKLIPWVFYTNLPLMLLFLIFNLLHLYFSFFLNPDLFHGFFVTCKSFCRMKKHRNKGTQTKHKWKALGVLVYWGDSVSQQCLASQSTDLSLRVSCSTNWASRAPLTYLSLNAISRIYQLYHLGHIAWVGSTLFKNRIKITVSALCGCYHH